MDAETVDIVLVILFLAGMALFGLAMLALVLRVGPRRGYWNQPAAMLRRPGRRLILAMYGMAALHVLFGLIGTFVVPGGELAVLVVLTLTGGFYVLLGHAWGLAHRLSRGREGVQPRYGRSEG